MTRVCIFDLMEFFEQKILLTFIFFGSLIKVENLFRNLKEFNGKYLRKILII